MGTNFNFGIKILFESFVNLILRLRVRIIVQTEDSRHQLSKVDRGKLYNSFAQFWSCISRILFHQVKYLDSTFIENYGPDVGLLCKLDGGLSLRDCYILRPKRSPAPQLEISSAVRGSDRDRNSKY